MNVSRQHMKPKMQETRSQKYQLTGKNKKIINTKIQKRGTKQAEKKRQQECNSPSGLLFDVAKTTTPFCQRW